MNICWEKQFIEEFETQFNWFSLNAAYMRHWIVSAFVQMMACRLLSAKLLSKPMPACCQLDLQEQTSVKFNSKYKNFHSQKCISKYRLQNGDHFVLRKMFK